MYETKPPFNELRKARNVETCLRLMEGAEYAILHITDLVGSFKGRTIPAKEAKRAIADGVGLDGSSVFMGVGVEESDVLMKPDVSTFTVYPYYFYERGVISFICDVYRSNGKRLESDPRYICQRVAGKLMAQGYAVTAAAEIEFYLVRKTESGVPQPIERHVADEQRYFDIAPDRDVTEAYRMELSSALLTMGIEVERQHHEAGSAQSEITFKHSDPVTTSDNVMRYKFAAKAVAERKYGWVATFMPKPWFGKPGSGMHIHIGLFDSRSGRNLFYDPDGYAQVSRECRYFIGGILEHARALCAVVAPTVNSYKRLIPGYEAPAYVTWGKANRSALVRVPDYPREREGEVRVEFRCPDPLCNPYLAYAVVLEAGLDGIRRRIEPSEPMDVNVYRLSGAERKRLGIMALPRSLKEALEEWGSDEICLRALGKEAAERYVELKILEWKEYGLYVPRNRREVTAWELQKYLYA